jgi:hypothetical protein
VYPSLIGPTANVRASAGQMPNVTQGTIARKNEERIEYIQARTQPRKPDVFDNDEFANQSPKIPYNWEQLTTSTLYFIYIPATAAIVVLKKCETNRVDREFRPHL